MQELMKWELYSTHLITNTLYSEFSQLDMTMAPPEACSNNYVLLHTIEKSTDSLSIHRHTISQLLTVSLQSISRSLCSYIIHEKRIVRVAHKMHQQTS